MRNKYKDVKPYSINIPQELRDAIDTSKFSVSEAVRETLAFTTLQPHYLWEIVDRRGHNYYLIHPSTNRQEMINLLRHFAGYDAHFKTEGLGSYEFRIVGGFPKLEDCMRYKEFLINKALNTGNTNRNSTSEYNRYVLFGIEYTHYIGRCLEHCDLNDIVRECIDLINDHFGCRLKKNLLNINPTDIRDKLRAKINEMLLAPKLD